MPAPNPIETALARLMPPALSQAGQRSIEAMLDELAAAVSLPATPVTRQPLWARRFRLPLGIAAALAVLLALVPRIPTGALPMAMARPASAKASALVLISESDRVETMSDEGWVADPDGGAMQAMRVRVVEANTLRDEETGIVVQVSDPREEMILTPVTVF
ncbi:MAG: hypothetical protein DVB26_06750 [Verrucomicrobia bacterium]|nr:MAG: hypothetical protein DVB26_06750 [Verrucomicrobiota bacterium]